MSAQLLGVERKAGSVAGCVAVGLANVASIKTMPPPHKIVNRKSQIENRKSNLLTARKWSE